MNLIVWYKARFCTGARRLSGFLSPEGCFSKGGIGFHNLIFRLKALFFTDVKRLSGFLSPEKESLRKKESQRGQGCGSRKKDKLFSCSAIPFPLWKSPTPLLWRYRLLRESYFEKSTTFSPLNKRTIPKLIPFGMAFFLIKNKSVRG